MDPAGEEGDEAVSDQGTRQPAEEITAEGEISVLLADDHQVVREGLCTMLESARGVTVVGQAASGQQAVALATRLKPRIVLLDLRMGGMDGAEATGDILRESPRSKVILLTTYEGDSDILRAMKAGAVGYLLKGSSRADLIDAVRAAARGEKVLTPTLALKLFRARAVDTPPLSEREVEVLRLVGQGLTNAAIGERLFIGESTVKTHLLRAYRKLGVSDRTAAVMSALERGFLP